MHLRTTVYQYLSNLLISLTSIYKWADNNKYFVGFLVLALDENNLIPDTTLAIILKFIIYIWAGVDIATIIGKRKIFKR